ncbi:hypothetical protein GQ600_20586 [Phytophthora cactorum]|nr:hypothetical protein GQ600_20586 [Phytophthora cactorum]
MLIVHTHKYFLAEAQQRLDPLGRAVRERVAKLRFGEHGCACAERTRRGSICGARGCPPRSRSKITASYQEIINDLIYRVKPRSYVLR